MQDSCDVLNSDSVSNTNMDNMEIPDTDSNSSYDDSEYGKDDFYSQQAEYNKILHGLS